MQVDFGPHHLRIRGMRLDKDIGVRTVANDHSITHQVSKRGEIELIVRDATVEHDFIRYFCESPIWSVQSKHLRVSETLCETAGDHIGGRMRGCANQDRGGWIDSQDL